MDNVYYFAGSAFLAAGILSVVTIQVVMCFLVSGLIVNVLGMSTVCVKNGSGDKYHHCKKLF